jgi:tRNA(His) guanylyltransferase
MSSNEVDPLGDRLKAIEMQEAGRKMMPELPVIARLDGRAFHTYTRGMHRPFDTCMQAAMAYVTAALVKEFHAAIGYTQSDEITLVWPKPVLFDGRYQKLTSVLAGYCSAAFIQAARLYLPEKDHVTPCFDCRVFQVPSQQEAIEVLAWREADAVKNSVAMAAQSVYSHKQLQGKKRQDMMEMLFQKGINWNDYPVHFKRGIYFKRTTRLQPLTEAERSRIPEQHRQPADHLVVRTFVEQLDIPPIRQVESPVDLVFPKPVEEL